MQDLSCRCIYKYLRSRVCGDIKPPRYLGPGLRPRPIKTAARRRRQSHAAMGPAYQPVLLLLSLWLHCTVTRAHNIALHWVQPDWTPPPHFEHKSGGSNLAAPSCRYINIE